MTTTATPNLTRAQADALADARLVYGAAGGPIPGVRRLAYTVPSATRWALYRRGLVDARDRLTVAGTDAAECIRAERGQGSLADDFDDQGRPAPSAAAAERMSRARAASNAQARRRPTKGDLERAHAAGLRDAAARLRNRAASPAGFISDRDARAELRLAAGMLETAADEREAQA